MPSISPPTTSHTTSRTASPEARQPVRVALIGAGKMGRHHADALDRLDNLARLVAIVDPDPGARGAASTLRPGIRVHATLEDALAAGGIDAVHICTTPATHAGLAAIAIDAGCHVYVEKPFTERAIDAELLVARARATGCLVRAGHQLLFESPTARLHTLAAAVGDIVHVESVFSFRTVRRAPGGRAPLRADLQLRDVLPHPVYLLLDALDAAAPGASPELRSVEIGPGGTMHALVKQGRVMGTLFVTLEGRPVESRLELVGTNGMVRADYVRGTVQHLIGPGTSSIDKILNPFRLARQLVMGTTTALAHRFARRQRSYPGLVESFTSFYSAILAGERCLASEMAMVETVRLCEHLGDALDRHARPPAPPLATAEDPVVPSPRDCVVVTGGTGLLGREIAVALAGRGTAVRVLARREPAPWERIAGVDYVMCDLARPLPPRVLDGATTVVHCAAETAGGWDEHQANSIASTSNVIEAAATARASIVHVSSLAVVDGGGIVSEASPLVADGRGMGPYVWGKLESERVAERLAAEHRLQLRIIRPGALIDDRRFDPPGRLGRRIGNIFVAVGPASDRLGVADVRFSARTIAWIVTHCAEAPHLLHLLDPELPSRRELVARLRRGNPSLRVIWLPRPAVVAISVVVTLLQRVLRPGRPPISVARVFAPQRYDTGAIARLAPLIDEASCVGAPGGRSTPLPVAVGAGDAARSTARAQASTAAAGAA